ncbi:MAG: 30S ribosomal protein S20 [Gammaproteobacteria bacterium RBG_16_57_12]|nr:MAG: 30S ribosomal protein S20 [Gammaproteobacteria bacterium RBG_16_57_12]
MANTAQAKKRARQAEVRRSRNVGQRSSLRTAVKKVVNALASKDKSQAEAAYKIAVPALDKMARKGIINKSKAARHKSRLNAHIKAL